MTPAHMTRRGFLTTAAAGAAISILPLRSALADLQTGTVGQPPNWMEGGRVRFRRDGIQKVTGDKVFAIDIRARDMKGWPEEQSHALILRAARTDAVFDGVTVEPLGALAPDILVTDDELERDGVQMVEADFYGRLLLKKGEGATYLGQPLAILIWHDYGRFRAAKARMRFNQDAVRYGAAATPAQRAPYGAARFVRIGGERPEAPDVFSPLKDSLVFADLSSGEEQWPVGDARGDAGGRALNHAQALRDKLANPPTQWRVWKRTFHSQSVDPAALEPDNGNAWFDAANGTLHVVTGSQSPFTNAQHIAQMAKASSFGFNDLKFYPGYTVGYGQKEHHVHPYYVAVAALYGDGAPFVWRSTVTSIFRPH